MVTLKPIDSGNWKAIQLSVTEEQKDLCSNECYIQLLNAIP